MIVSYNQTNLSHHFVLGTLLATITHIIIILFILISTLKKPSRQHTYLSLADSEIINHAVISAGPDYCHF